MAKFDAYYTLCPLIDQQNLLGVKKDAEIGCAVVTLGRNIVIRYKLQDLKQISSWSSKERLSSEVIYDITIDKYAAVFTENFVKIWSADETTLDNVKKYKFSKPINKLLTFDGIPPIVVQQNGATASLEWCLKKKNRSKWNSEGFLKEGEQLLECKLINVKNQTYLCAITKIGEGINYVHVPLRGDNYMEEVNNLTRIELKRSAEKLVGHIVIHDANKAHLLTLWSHGRLYSYPISFPSTEPAPGTLVSVVKSVNTNHPVVIVTLNESTIAMYGADDAEEGAVLVIYNIQFKLTQAIQKLKLYTRDAKLWKIDDKLLLAANRHLAVTSFRLQSMSVGAMAGSSLNLKTYNANKSENDDIMIIQEIAIENWDDSESKTVDLSTIAQISSNLPKAISKQINCCINEGLDDADILSSIMTDLIERKDLLSITWCLNNFKDIPEKVLIELLLFGLRTKDQIFKPVQNGHSNHDMEIDDNVNSRNTFLDKIFEVSNSEMQLIYYLKNSLKFEEVLKLLDYLITKLEDDLETMQFEQAPNYKQLYEWTSLLLDSHYQQYILSQDPIVLQRLNQLHKVLETHFEHFNDLENLRPMIKRIMDGKSLKMTPQTNNKFYSIQDFKLY